MNMNVSLTKELGDFVKEKVTTGRYTSASEVVRDALRLLERQEQENAAKLAVLQRAYQQGLASGDARPLDVEKFKAQARRRHGSTVAGDKSEPRRTLK